MPKQIQEPGPGRSTAAAAFDELRKEIAQATSRPTRRLASFGPSASGSRSSPVGGGTFRNIPWRWAIVT
jgi:hypothetical protein